jgi:hypothetical protein
MLLLGGKGGPPGGTIPGGGIMPGGNPPGGKGGRAVRHRLEGYAKRNNSGVVRQSETHDLQTQDLQNPWAGHQTLAEGRQDVVDQNRIRQLVGRHLIHRQR